MTIVIPVRDRAAELDRCLAAAGSRYPVLVADDGSADPAAVAAVCAAHGARLLRRDISGGPGPARNTALARARTEFVAFLDSDCIPPPAWIEALAGHFADPLVAAVAPRVVAAGPDCLAGPAGPARALIPAWPALVVSAAPVTAVLRADPATWAPDGWPPEAACWTWGAGQPGWRRSPGCRMCRRPPWWSGAPRSATALTPRSGTARTST